MKLANLLLILMICLLSLESFASSASRRRSRRAYQSCINQAESMPAPVIDCSTVNRPEYIQNYLKGYGFDTCQQNRHLRDETQLTNAARAHVREQATVQQCFGHNFYKVTPEESLFMDKFRKEQEEKSRVLKLVLGSVFLAAIVGLFVSARNGY